MAIYYTAAITGSYLGRAVLKSRHPHGAKHTADSGIQTVPETAQLTPQAEVARALTRKFPKGDIL
jgi:hypothetical protein